MTDQQLVEGVEAAARSFNQAISAAAANHIQSDIELVEVTGFRSPVVETRVVVRRMAKVLGGAVG